MGEASRKRKSKEQGKDKDEDEEPKLGATQDWMGSTLGTTRMYKVRVKLKRGRKI